MYTEPRIRSWGRGNRWRRVNYIGYKISGEADKNVLNLTANYKTFENLKHKERET